MTISILSLHDDMSDYYHRHFSEMSISFSHPNSDPYIFNIKQDEVNVDTSLISSFTDYIEPFVSPHSFHGESGILPPGLLYLTRNYLVFERPPCYQNVFLINNRVEDINYEYNDPVMYRLPIPWQLYMVGFTRNSTLPQEGLLTASVRMHFMQGPLMSIEQPMFMAPLTNLYTSGQLCPPMFNEMDDIERYSKDISGVMQSAYDWVWNSGANLDLTESIVHYFTQSKDDYTNTVFTDNYPPPSGYSINSYYSDSSHVDYLYKLWESIPLSEVSNLKWPSNSISYKFQQDHQNTVEFRLRQYFIENNIQPLNEDGCEDCVSYPEDEDGEPDYDSDSYHYSECECSCHNDPEFDRLHFLRWAGVFPPKPVTFSESFKNFTIASSLTRVPYAGAKTFFTNNSVTQAYGNIIDSVILRASSTNNNSDLNI